MAKADDLADLWGPGTGLRVPRMGPSAPSPEVTQGEDSLNQLAMRLKAGNAKWTAEQRKDIELLATATKSLLLALSRLSP